ncbi:MAG: carboxylating nicotinate-nucleotide diphosphorylase [Methylococcaceae bacterium]|nr:carboxylating nicotinate-nucleotide diphosphorylase [Methylococcaceae bacterium]
MLIHSADIERLLEEDIGVGDVTALIVPQSTRATAEVITRETMVVCGQAWFAAVFEHLDAAVSIQWPVAEGTKVAAGTLLCRLQGPARSLLTGERTALNLLQTLSATATEARRYAEVVADLPVQILDTRKTIPGLRKAQKYAVRCGGCHNHRMGLYDGILIKENHILAAGSIAKAVMQARDLGADIPVEVEVETLDELMQAIEAGAERILLDNFELSAMRQAVVLTARRAKLEVSGNVELAGLRAIAETGVDFISIGALTKNVKAIDLSMRITLLR